MGQLKEALMAPNIVEQYENPAESKMLNCQKHGDYEGFETRINGKDIRSICPICLSIENREEQKLIFEQSRLNASKALFKKSAIPPKYQRKRFEDYAPPNEGSKAFKKLMMRYASSFKAVTERGVSFFIIGTTGTGKTHLACSVAMEVIRQGYTAMYTDMIDIPTQIKRSWTSGSEHSEYDFIEGYVKPSLLIVDEIGLGQLDMKEKRMIFSVIKRRHEMDRPTLYISNYTEAQARKALGDPAIRRMVSGGGKIINCNWGDYTEQTRGTF